MSSPFNASSVFDNAIAEHLAVIGQLRAQRPTLERIAAALTRAILSGNKILWCGNGGSAADSQHMAAEFVGRFRRERRGLPSIALTTDTSALTSIGNDYGFEKIFSRQVEAHCGEGDVLVGISTSGNSSNVCRALECARSLGAYTVAFTGEGRWGDGRSWLTRRSAHLHQRPLVIRKVTFCGAYAGATGGTECLRKRSCE